MLRICSGNPRRDCNEKPDLKEEIGASETSVDFPTEGYVHISTPLNAGISTSLSVKMYFISEKYWCIFGVLQKIGVDWFRQQDQWVR